MVEQALGKQTVIEEHSKLSHRLAEVADIEKMPSFHVLSLKKLQCNKSYTKRTLRGRMERVTNLANINCMV